MKKRRRLGYSATIAAAEWLRRNRVTVEKNAHDLERVRRMIESDLDIDIAPTGIVRLCHECGISLSLPDHGRGGLAEVAVLLANSIQHLYEALGEQPHPALLAVRQLYGTPKSNSIEHGKEETPNE